MAKGKRKHPSIEDILARPFCYYCERDFDDLKILIQHQKAKHFRCGMCNRRLNTAGGLSVHMSQVHKEPLELIENALPNRQHINIEIFAMEGIPEDIIQHHNQRLTQEYYSAEAEHRAVTGNPASGSGQQAPPGAKKPKIESAEELRKRLAEHKAKKAAEQANGNGSGNNTPGAQAAQAASPPVQHFSPAYPPGQTTPPQAAFSHPYAQPPHTQPPYAQPPYAQQSSPFGFNGGPFSGPTPHQQGPFGPPGFGPPQSQPYRAPDSSFSYSPAPPNYPTPPPGIGMPMGSFPPVQKPMERFGPPPGSSFGSNHAPEGPQRQNSLPSAPGLPQRPSFDAPPVSRSQLQEMHHGQVQAPAQPQQSQQQPSVAQNISSDIDDLISNAQQNTRAPSLPGKTTPEIATAPTKTPEKNGTPKPAATGTTHGKKSKNASRMVVSDQSESAEEKMARLPRFAFRPKKREEVVRGPVEAAVTGPVRGSDDVADAVQG